MAYGTGEIVKGKDCKYLNSDCTLHTFCRNAFYLSATNEAAEAKFSN